jgi:vacuolar-type H+-ATPase subunit H
MEETLPQDVGGEALDQNPETKTEEEVELSKPTCEAVPSLYAVLSREAEFQNLVKEAYERQEKAIEDAYERAPELVTGDMTPVYERVDKIRAEIAKSTQVEIDDLEQQSAHNCEKYHSQKGAYNDKARDYVIGLITGTVTAESKVGEVPVC